LAIKEVNQIVANAFDPKTQGLLENLKIQMIVPADRKQTVTEIIEKNHEFN
jgi:hypothetical protein